LIGAQFFKISSGEVACIEGLKFKGLKFKGLKFKGLKFKVDPKAQLLRNDMLIAPNVAPKTQLRRIGIFKAFKV